jgi:glycosyltransferase involved in cell wall biosynthesis
MKFNILIRTKAGREDLLKNCLASIEKQTYKNYNIIIGSEYKKEGTVLLKQNLNLGEYFYNDYCNTLKDLITDGYFFFLDDDDILINKYALERIAKHLKGDGLICQMQRGENKLKPNDLQIESKQIESGKIGMPCLVLHSKHKNLVDIPATSNGDFVWIKEISKLVDLHFVKEVLVYSQKRSFGL